MITLFFFLSIFFSNSSPLSSFVPRQMENFLENCSDTFLPTRDNNIALPNDQPPGLSRRVGLVGEGENVESCPSLVGFPSIWSEEEVKTFF